MDDKELLEKAALAAGYKRTRYANNGMFQVHFWHEGYEDDWEYWDAEDDNGDALRLFLKLPWMCLETSDVGVCVRERENMHERRVFLKFTEYFQDHNGNIEAATRRAIVRAAAYFGALKEVK